MNSNKLLQILYNYLLTDKVFCKIGIAMYYIKHIPLAVPDSIDEYKVISFTIPPIQQINSYFS